MLRKFLFLSLPLALISGCKSTPPGFFLEPPDFRSVVHAESGFYVHREVELRVNPKRLSLAPVDAARGAVPELRTAIFFPSGSSSANFIPDEFEMRDGYMIWKEVRHVSNDDYEGLTSCGAQIIWEKDGAVSVGDAMEIFRFPHPELNQINTWSDWFEASDRREGIFAWHSEANEHASEKIDAPVYSFQMRFKLILSQRMYP